jgi:hypothetical protein
MVLRETGCEDGRRWNWLWIVSSGIIGVEPSGSATEELVYEHQDRSRDSAVGIATGYGLDGRGVTVRVPVGARFFSSACRPDRFWGSPSLLYNGYRGHSGRVVKLTTRLQLVPRSRICGSIHPLPHKETPWLWSASELCRPSDRPFLAK